MIPGLSTSEYNYLSDKLILPLKKLGATVYLFGSRANNKYKKYSDIDLLYTPSEARPIKGHELHLLLTEIEESDFPYKIDLVCSNDLAQSYRASVEKEKILI
jgi:predicted nucleotidyltransferase